MTRQCLYPSLYLSLFFVFVEVLIGIQVWVWVLSCVVDFVGRIRKIKSIAQEFIFLVVSRSLERVGVIVDHSGCV